MPVVFYSFSNLEKPGTVAVAKWIAALDIQSDSQQLDM